MKWLIGLLIAQTVLEGVVCADYIVSLRLQKAACSVLAIALVLISAGLVATDWQMWVWIVPLSMYRLINLRRIALRHTALARLRTTGLGAFNWLLVGQILAVLAAWLIKAHHWQYGFLNAVALGQLLVAMVLLRASTHMWYHAGMPVERTALSDRELPTLSVLIPARNETDALNACLQALVASDYPKLEIVVLDDASTTRKTPEIIKSFAHAGVRYVPGGASDATRWLPKNYAYERLSQEASGDVLLFCGVDLLVAPHSLRQLVTTLENRKKDMLSVMPLRNSSVRGRSSLLQTMRYYWEMCLPRRFFKRPPVLSTCWLIRREALKRMGGFASVSHSITPEAPLARQAVITDSYSFIRSDEALGISSTKPASEQYATYIRVRYPQLHRRLELVAVTALFELVFLIGPLLGLCVAPWLAHAMAYGLVWGVALLCVFTTYGLVAGGARLVNRWWGWLLMPLAFIEDLVMLHLSMWRYEFGVVEWKGRNVSAPVTGQKP